MAKCEYCSKEVLFGKSLSFSRSHVSRRSNSKQKPNIRKVRIVENGQRKSVHICAKCLRANKVERAV